MNYIKLFFTIGMMLAFLSPAMGAYSVQLNNTSVTEQSVHTGLNATYIVNLTNNGTSGGDSYTISVDNLDGATVAELNVTSPIFLDQDAFQTFQINVSSSIGGTYKVNISASSHTGDSMSVNTTTTFLTYDTLLENVTSTQLTTTSGTNVTHILNLTNTGTDSDTYTLSITNIDSASTAEINITSVTLGSGESQNMTLNVTNTISGIFRVNVTAISTGDATKVGYINTTTTVNAIRAVNVTNTSVKESSENTSSNVTYTFEVTNNGTDTDSYLLTIDNLQGVSISELNVTSPISLTVGQVTQIRLNVSNNLQGTYRVNVTATSVNDSLIFQSLNTTTTLSALRGSNLTNVSLITLSAYIGTNATYTLILVNNGTDPDSYTIDLTNIDSASNANVNLSTVYLDSLSSQTITLNVSNSTPSTMLRVNVTATSVNDTSKATYVNTTTSVYSVPNITAFSPEATITDLDAIISRTFSITVDQSATVTYYINGVSVGSAIGTTVTYTNSTPALGTYTVSATATTLAGSATNTWIWNIPSSTISNLTVVVNQSNNRAVINTNSSLNFSFIDNGNVSYINLTIPSTFKFNNLIASDISSTIGTCTIFATTSTLITCYNADGLNNTEAYLNLTGNVTMPIASGTYPITVTTNKNVTGSSVNVYVRDSASPFFVTANNSVFTVSSETFGTYTTTIQLIGTGVSNITLYAPNITGQTNVTVGYSATNVTSLWTNYTPLTNPPNTIYIVTNGTVTNPIIVVSAPVELQSRNLGVIITAGLISSLLVLYTLRRRRH